MTATSAALTFASILRVEAPGHLPKLVAYGAVTASRTMATSLRSRSFREPRPCYGKLHESQGRSLEGRLHRALSLRQGREKSRSQGLAGTEGLEVPVQERLPGTLGDTEQLIQTQGEGSQRWLRQYQQQVRRRWKSFVASFPGVTLNRPASPETLLDTNS
ncbi:uncharacterized protein C11orf86 homolog isoform X1 [Peromyscus leucopus]|uniref:uncharacterized protein C11orf86 homolog isoform X1 n=1 Tax=Peromyscus leucopus TaxID=10041 RepID=UPI0018850107|nr:uncharacterized protein C11orf86 homolog isoform X1 [Peromyscus leucopus]